MVGEGSGEVYAEQFCAALKGKGQRAGRHTEAKAPDTQGAGRLGAGAPELAHPLAVRVRPGGSRRRRRWWPPRPTPSAGWPGGAGGVAAAPPVGREQLAREADTLEEQRGRYDRILGEKQAVGAEIARRAVQEHDAWQAGRDRWGALDEAEGQAVVALHALEAQVARRRAALGRVEQAIRERARDLGVRLEPGEVPDPPPDPPPGPPGQVEATLAWRRQLEAG